MAWIWEEGANSFWQQLWATFIGVLLGALLAWGTQTFFHRRSEENRRQTQLRRQFELTMALIGEFVQIQNWLGYARETVTTHGAVPMVRPDRSFWDTMQGELVAGGLPFDVMAQITLAYVNLDWVMEGVEWLRRINDDPTWIFAAQQDKYYTIFQGKRQLRIQNLISRIDYTTECFDKASDSISKMAKDLMPYADAVQLRGVDQRIASSAATEKEGATT